MTKREFTDKLLCLFEEAMLSPNDYINPYYLSEITTVIDKYIDTTSKEYPLVQERLDKIDDYIHALWEM